VTTVTAVVEPNTGALVAGDDSVVVVDGTVCVVTTPVAGDVVTVVVVDGTVDPAVVVVGAMIVASLKQP
jgi:hypothetical protein